MDFQKKIINPLYFSFFFFILIHQLDIFISNILSSFYFLFLLLVVVTIVYGKPKKLVAELQTMSLSLRRFVTLPKNVQADYQPLSPQDKTVQITV